jgi:hypothetical protein
MNTTMTLDELKRHLREQFATGVPNGWTRGWNHGRLQSELAAAVQPLKVENCTSFDYAFCNHFEVRVDGGHPRWLYELTIRISFVGDFFCLHWTRRQPASRKGGTVRSPGSAQASMIEQTVRELLERHGFREIPDEWLDEPVPVVRLELAGTRNVTISKCLFEDYDG